VSEQAKIVLKEKIKDVNKNTWVSLIPFQLGILCVVYGVLDLTLRYYSFTPQIIFMLMTIGIACMVIGICMSIPYIRQYYKLKKELESVATSFPRCPKCLQEMPQGNYAFCPFCGNSLKK
jgi:ribosomal protein S27AE